MGWALSRGSISNNGTLSMVYAYQFNEVRSGVGPQLDALRCAVRRYVKTVSDILEP
jgi:hypothetical protein